MPECLDRDSKAEQQVAKAVACRATSAYGVCRCQTCGCRSYSRVGPANPRAGIGLLRRGRYVHECSKLRCRFQSLQLG